MQRYDYFNIHSHKDVAQSDVLTIFNTRFGVEKLHPNCQFYSIGIHPYDVNNQALNDVRLDINFNCVAIGEIGLDYRPEYKFELQKEIFVKQLKMANNYKLPVIIHCVKAFYDLIKLLNENHIEKAIFHGFNNKFETAHKILSSGYTISFGDNLLKNSSLQQIFKHMVDQYQSSIFFETDESNVSIKDIYECGANIAGIELEQLKMIVKQNFENYFGKSIVESANRVDVRR